MAARKEAIVVERVVEAMVARPLHRRRVPATPARAASAHCAVARTPAPPPPSAARPPAPRRPPCRCSTCPVLLPHAARTHPPTAARRSPPRRCRHVTRYAAPPQPPPPVAPTPSARRAHRRAPRSSAPVCSAAALRVLTDAHPPCYKTNRSTAVPRL